MAYDAASQSRKSVRLLSSASELDPTTPLSTDKLKTKVAAGRIPVVVVACGSYSPVTIMHLRILEDTRDYLNMGDKYEVIGGFISLTHDKYGKRTLAPMHHRINMTALAVADSDWINVDTWECAQAEWTRTARVLTDRFAASTADVAVQIGDEAPQKGVIKVMFSCGADLLESFTRIKDDGTPLWSFEDQELILRNGVAVVRRQGVNIDELLEHHARMAAFRDNIVQFNAGSQNKVSSTLVRDLLCRGHSIKYLVPEGAHEYIYEHNLKDLPNWQPQA
eukprot:m.451557 g.451557  ORF g.451557 m.451557 type:complete len:278 (+) comp20171_c0_seq1:129-962(+)